MDEWTLQEEAYEKGRRAGRHELAKEMEEVKKERDYYRDMSTDLRKSIRGMKLEIEYLRNELIEKCERCPDRVEDDWDD